MRKLIFSIFSGGCAALAMTAAAQDEPPGIEPKMPQAGAAIPGTQSNPEQRMQYDAWSVQERTTYDRWSADHQAYFWTLSPQRQTIYWRLSEADRAAIAAMVEADRETVWRRVEAQVAKQPLPSTSREASPPPPPQPDREGEQAPPMR